jgi:hypothetical protein
MALFCDVKHKKGEKSALNKPGNFKNGIILSFIVTILMVHERKSDVFEQNQSEM